MSNAGSLNAGVNLFAYHLKVDLHHLMIPGVFLFSPGKEGGADSIDDPELKMLHDEHQSQLQKLQKQLDEEKRKLAKFEREGDGSKEELERLRDQYAKDKSKWQMEKAEVPPLFDV